jgi:GLPGLI family protein
MAYRNLKVSIFFSFALLLWSEAVSQSNNTEGVVDYAYRMKTFGSEEHYQLKFNKTEAVYLHHQEERTIISPQGYEIISPRKIFDWYLNFKSKKVTEQEKKKDGKLIYATFDAIQIEWEIQNETKTILGYSVQKAVAKTHHFVKGKGTIEYGDAIAWFATDLPFPSGPERFWGLPGLILELSFTKFIGVYVAEKLTFEAASNLIPNQGTQVTKEILYKDRPWLGKARELMNTNN